MARGENRRIFPDQPPDHINLEEIRVPEILYGSFQCRVIEWIVSVPLSPRVQMSLRRSLSLCWIDTITTN